MWMWAGCGHCPSSSEDVFSVSSTSGQPPRVRARAHGRLQTISSKNYFLNSILRYFTILVSDPCYIKTFEMGLKKKG